MRSRAFWSALAPVVVCTCAPGAARAQLPGDVRTTPLSGSQMLLPYTAPAIMSAGPPFGPVGPGPRVAVGVGVAAGFGYPGFGPGFGFPGFGFPVYSGRAGSVWSNGLSLYGPPVPVPGSIPGVFGNSDLVEQWRHTLWPGFAGPGWVGVGVSVAPRPPISFGPRIPTVEGLRPPPGPPPRVAKIGGVLIISVKVPQPAAEVRVDGRKTTQTGTDRIFESPPLEGGATARYTVTARWVERGRVVEASREVSGTPGEVVRVDFTVP